MAYEIDENYIDVAARIAEFREKHPEGSLEQDDLQFLSFADKDWIVYRAAAYRTPDDPRPGHGTAWEPVPGRTPYTKDSELQNAETAAWGRAIVAALAADTKRGIATADEVRNRQADRDQETRQPARQVPPPSNIRQQQAEAYRRAADAVWELSRKREPDLDNQQRRLWLNGELAERGLNGNDVRDLENLANQLRAELSQEASR